MAQRCNATNRAGSRCGEWAQPGQRVCHLHGGRSPQALRKADERMRDLVHPAISALERQINQDEFAAVKYVLDWAGFRPTDQLPETDGHLRVTVHFDHANQQTLDIPDSA